MAKCLGPTLSDTQIWVFLRMLLISAAHECIQSLLVKNHIDWNKTLTIKHKTHF